MKYEIHLGDLPVRLRWQHTACSPGSQGNQTAALGYSWRGGFAADGYHLPRCLRRRQGDCRRHHRGLRRSERACHERGRQNRAALPGWSAVGRPCRVSSCQQGSDRPMHHAGRQGGGSRRGVSAQRRQGAPGGSQAGRAVVLSLRRAFQSPDDATQPGEECDSPSRRQSSGHPS